MNTVMVRINPPLKNVQLSDALEAIVHTADKPIRYSIEDYAVIFSQNQPGTAHLETRTFHVDPKAFIQRLQKKFPGAMDPQQLIRRFFTAIGVDVLPPNMVFFNDRRGTLMLRATSEELRRVQDAIDALGGGGSKEIGQGFPTV